MIYSARSMVQMPQSGHVAHGDPRAVQALKQEFLVECRRAFDRFFSENGALFGNSFSEIEEAAEQALRSMGVVLCEKRLAADPLANPDRGFTCPKCHKRMRVQQRAQDRAVSSTLGKVEVERPYCVCDSCNFCCAPLDYALGIPAKGPSVGRRELICNAATKDRSFEKAQRTLSHHSKIQLSDEAIRKLAESEGRKLIEARARRVEECFRNRGRIAQPQADMRQTLDLLVVTCDGGMVQTRDKENRWKSDKIGCVYNADPQTHKNAATAEGYHGASAITKTYAATMEPWQELGRMLFAEACHRGYMQARQKLFLSDAAAAILSLRDEHFSDAYAIIDWYHAAEHLDDCAKAAHTAGTAEPKHWFELNKDRLWRGQVKRVIQAIRTESHQAGSPPKDAPDTDPRVVLHRNVGYFTNNRHAMDYPTYRANGWPIGSGVAEGSVKQFGLRVKGSEQFWNLWGAEEMLALCELYFSEDDRWVNYWRERATPPADAILLRAPMTSSPPPNTISARSPSGPQPFGR